MAICAGIVERSRRANRGKEQANIHGPDTQSDNPGLASRPFESSTSSVPDQNAEIHSPFRPKERWHLLLSLLLLSLLREQAGNA